MVKRSSKPKFQRQQNQKYNKSWKNNQPAGVPEATRTRLKKILEEFGETDGEVYTFEDELTNTERAVVHQLSRTMGMKSKSTGKDAERRVSVYKTGKIVKKDKKKKCPFPFLAFSNETKKVLQDLFTRHPPQEEELSNRMLANHGVQNWKRRKSRDDAFCKPNMSKKLIKDMVEQATKRMTTDPKLRQIAEARSKLPIASFKDTITSTLESHQVVLIAGETGCGKTTQVPQFLLDYMWGKHKTCKILCTQPRRISAISVAERIAYERGENIGTNVGYKIRLESRGGKQSSIMFCTNGILLRVLVEKGVPTETENLEPLDITHIIVDEIHERDRHSDFMLTILRDMLPSYPHLRLILMSATIDSDRFSQYFGGCPTIRVPGFMHPVKSYFLEDVLALLKPAEVNHLASDSSCGALPDADLTEDYIAALDEAIDMALSNDEFDSLVEFVSSQVTSRVYNYQHSLTGASPLMVFSGKGRVGDVCMLLSFGADCNLRSKDGATALEWAQRENHTEIADIIKQRLENPLLKSAEQELLQSYLSTVDPEIIDIVLIERLLRKICIDSEEGAVLVFLPGWDAINKTRDMLLASYYFRDSNKFLILALHSMVPPGEQKKVFTRPNRHVRKIILSTNIAETAVTIDDVVYVIDSGRMKEKSYDPYKNVSTLHSSWISKASAKQRQGRAGRCQPGICYHLYSKSRAESLLEFQVPEIKRIPIEELCLQVKLLDPSCQIEHFLQKTLDPPVFETIRNAIMVLQDLGALTADEALTELGRKIGHLPVHPSTSKMLFFAILMNCLDPALTLACASENKDPFIMPMLPAEKKKADRARAELASTCGGLSDQLTVIAAYDCWKRAKDQGQESLFCSKYYVSSSAMHMLSAMRKQLQQELVKHEFISENISSYNLNAKDPGILNAVLVAGSYPRIGKLLPRKYSGQRLHVETASGAKVRLHPKSCNFNTTFGSNHQTLVLYDEVTHGDTGMHIRNSTVIGAYSLLFLSAEMVVAPPEDYIANESTLEDGEAMSGDEETTRTSAGELGRQIMSAPNNTVSVVIDRWLTFTTTALDVAQIYCLRERLNAAILFKVKFTREVLPPDLGASVYAIACLLSYDGLSGISAIPRKGDDSNSFLKSLMGSDNLQNPPLLPRSGGQKRGGSFKRKRGNGHY